MEPTKLTQFYDDLKSKLDTPVGPSVSKPINVGMGPNAMMSPGAQMWRNKAAHHCEHLKDKCRKHILLDIYCKVLPLDDEYVDGHHGQMAQDVDDMLAKKGMTATQYLTSCYESTHAPLLEMILRNTDIIGRTYMEEATETLKAAQAEGEAIAEPKEPTPEDEEVENQLVDIKQDPEYETFIDKLKQKTINKIVSDISKIIADKKEEKQMTFDTSAPLDTDIAQESAVGVGYNYLARKLNGITFTEDQQDEILGMAIREATLHQFDIVFEQYGKDFRDFASMIRYDKGIVVNESAVNYFKSVAPQN